MLDIFAVSMIFPILLKRTLRFIEVNSPRSPSKYAIGIKLTTGGEKINKLWIKPALSIGNIPAHP